jgi:phage-related protein (TIGR01555 family)
MSSLLEFLNDVDFPLSRFDGDPNGPHVFDAPGIVRHDADVPFAEFSGFSAPKSTGINWSPLMLDDEHCRILWKRTGIARKIVNFPAFGATRKAWTVPDVPVETMRTIKAYPTIRLSMQHSRAYGGGPMLMVTEDDIPRTFTETRSNWLAQPLQLERVGRLRAVHALDPWQASPHTWDEDVTSPNWGLPATWYVTFGRHSGIVHASRIALFRGEERSGSELGGRGWGAGFTRMPDDSIFQAIYDEISRLADINEGAAKLAGEIRESVLTVGGLSAIKASDQGEAVLGRIGILAKAKRALNIILLRDNDKYETRTNPPTGWGELSLGAKEMLAAVSNMSQQELFGTTPGGLGNDGESGHTSTREFVSDFQEKHREPIELFHRVLYASQDGPTRGRIPPKWGVEFLPLDEPDEKTTAEVGLLKAQKDEINIRNGVYTPEDVTRGRYGEQSSDPELSDLEPVDLVELAETRVAAAREAMAASGKDPDAPAPEPGKPEPQGAQNREDAHNGAWVGVPARDTGLRDEVEQAIGQILVPETAPHVTILYLGGPLEPDEVDEVARAVMERAKSTRSESLSGGQVRAFPHGPDGTPIVVELESAWTARELNETLLRDLAHVVRAKQFPRYRAHVTIGYAPEPLTSEAHAAILELDASGVRVPLVELVVRNADKDVSRTQVTG